MKPRQPSAKEHLAQAEHNYFWAKNFCSLKAPNGQKTPFDWAATVSYYSAIHFFQYFLRKHTPVVGWKNKKHQIDSITEFQVKFEYEWSKHSIYEQIISNNYPESMTAWKHLFHTAHNARYNAQEVEILKARLSIAYLDEIKKKFGK